MLHLLHVYCCRTHVVADAVLLPPLLLLLLPLLLLRTHFMADAVLLLLLLQVVSLHNVSNNLRNCCAAAYGGRVLVFEVGVRHVCVGGG